MRRTIRSANHRGTSRLTRCAAAIGLCLCLYHATPAAAQYFCLPVSYNDAQPFDGMRAASWANDISFGSSQMAAVSWEGPAAAHDRVATWAPGSDDSVQRVAVDARLAAAPAAMLPTPLEQPLTLAGDELLAPRPPVPVDQLPPPPSDPGSTPTRAGNGQTGPTEDKPLGKAPEDNRLLFLREATVLLQPGQWQMDYGIAYSMQEWFRPIVLPNLNLSEDRFRDRRVYVPFALRAGVTKRLQAFCNAPFGVGMMDYTNGVVSTTDSAFGMLDVALGANYLLYKGKDFCPDVVVTVDGTIPVGPLPYRPDVTRAYLSDGFYSGGVNALFIHTYDPVVVFYGVGYRHRMERDYLGGVVTPGEEISYNLGAGFAINDRITFSTTLLGSYQTEYQFNGVYIPGSSQEPITLRFALTAFTGKCHIIEPFASVGMTRDAPDARLGINITRTF